MNRLLFSLVVPPMVAAGAPAAAQVDTPGAIVVTGASLPRADGEVAYDEATIDRDRLTATASDRIEDILGDVAGFAQYRRSDSRSAQPTSQAPAMLRAGRW